MRNKTFFAFAKIVLASLGIAMLTTSVARAEDSANVSVLKELYAAFGRGDVAAIGRLMSESVEWVHPGPKTIPFAGTFKGMEGVQRFFQIAGESIEVKDQKLLGFLEKGDQVAVLGFEHMKVKATGREYQSNWVHLYTLQDGRVVRFEEFIDTAALEAAFKP
jgi:ketosteroid isomerase-like protein